MEGWRNRLAARRSAYRSGGLAAAALVLLSLGVVSCAETLGAGGGALVGNQFGKGSGKTAATIGGAVGGAVLGHELAK